MYNSIMGRFSSLQRLAIMATASLGVLALLGYLGLSIVAPQEKPFYQPGVVPSRQECFYDRISKFKNLNKQILFQAAQECELEVQSVEGHEQARLEWLEREAERAKQRALQPQPKAEEPPQELDRVRRVWR